MLVEPPDKRTVSSGRVCLTDSTLEGSKMTVRMRSLSVFAVGVLAAGMVVAVAAPANAALSAGPSSTGSTGDRPGATEIPFKISDQVAVYVDVATGNLRVQNKSLSLVGVNDGVTIGQSYNSLSTTTGSTSTPAANKWTFDVSGVGFLSAGASGAVIYTAGDGATWSFTPVSGSPGSYTTPAGIKSDLAQSGSQWTLTERQSQQKTTFNSDGWPVSIADRNNNTTTIGYASAGVPNAITSSAGPVAARAASLTYAAGPRTWTVAQTSGSSSRSIVYTKNASSNLVSITDAEANTTTFGYSSQLLTMVTAPATSGIAGPVITIGYEAGTNRVLSVSQANTTSGSPGTSVTRFAYPSSTSRYVARPDTNQSLAVASVPHVTYTINATSNLVTDSTDEMNRKKSATYTPNGDTASTTTGTGATAGTATGTYGANGGDSLTSLAGPGGATSSAAYGNTAAATKYLPSSSTDSAGNNTTYTYNGAGNAESSSNALAANANLTHNSDGTVATATAPGNGSNQTVYTYNANKQLQTVTPVTGSSLGVRTFTYDDFGRTLTATNGRGITLTYTYDKQDRVSKVQASDSPTTNVTNTYTATGLLSSRIDGSVGNTTFTYDQLGRLIKRSPPGILITYAYDKSSNLVSVTDVRGTTVNAFDDSGVLTSMTYQTGSGAGATTKVLGFAVDDHGRRTDTWLRTDATHSVWTAHTHQDYDNTGRVSRVLSEVNPSGTVSTVVDISYCYNTATTAPTCSTGAGTDRNKLQWERNNLTGQSTAYSYDGAGRLLSAAQSGGTGANTYTYTYDQRGNRLTATVTGANPSSQTLTFNAANEIITAGYVYDGAGNLSADPSGTYEYNGFDQMKKVHHGTSTYTYTYAGSSQTEVVSQDSDAGAARLRYGRTNQQGLPVIESVVVPGAAVTAYVENDPVTGQPLLLRDTSSTEALYVYSGTGSPIALIVGTGSVAVATSFDPYGTVAVSSGSTTPTGNSNPYVFKGGIRDRATGWIHYGNRWYNPVVGQWTQQDTLDTPLDPNNANRYAYSGDDPVNNADPTGKRFLGFDSCFGEAAFGLALDVGFFVTLTAAVTISAAAAPETGGISVVAFAGGIAESQVAVAAFTVGTYAFLDGVICK